MPEVSPEPHTPFSSYVIPNPEEFAANLLRAYEKGSAALAEMAERPDAKGGPYSSAAEFSAAMEHVAQLVRSWLSDPVRFADAQSEFFTKFAGLWNYAGARMVGMKTTPLIEPAANDNRFKDAEWTENPFFDFIKQAYLLICDWAERRLAETPNLSERDRHRAEFYLRQVTSAFSPSNFLMLNPEVLRATFTTNARNLVEGVDLLAKDISLSGDLMKISQTDPTAFELGRNLATTPGKVVFQNELLQLIQYAPTTETVRERPLLMVPPWINKYYILDLTPQKSFIKYVVDQGYTVFVVSWVNPTEDLAERTFEDYILTGILQAADAVRRETGIDDINVLGYCVGGTALSTGLAYMSQNGDKPFKSCTLLTTQVDFSLAGDLLLFTDDAQLLSLEKLMNERGFLDGSRMANVFNMMRPRDLIWPYVINNYMLGKKPFPFDLLFWNQDSTRMAAANHKFYLREFYNENALSHGRMKIGGVPLDLSKITVPIFSIATKEDHIAPAPSVYRSSLKFGGPVEFVLSGSGHIAGVVNPPEKMKYQYWTDGARGETLEQWIETANTTAGSWWPYWIKWLDRHAGGTVDARQPGQSLGTIEDAPGSYVKAR